MKNHLLPCLLLLLALVIIPGAYAADTTGTASIAVTDYSVTPSQLMTGDTGTVSVTVKNTGNSPVSIHSADMDSPITGFRIINDKTYDTVGTLGAGDTTTFSFTFKADVADGTYYPKLYLDLTESGSYRFYIPVEVKSTELSVAVSYLPDSFNGGVQSDVNITIGNPRGSTVNGVTITPVGDGIRVTPQTAFIGSLTSDSRKEVTFSITPSKETTVTFLVSYRNGMNDHSTSVTLPITFSENKKGAKTVLNNVAIESGGQYNTITGDITNAGLTNAYSVTVTVGNPATPVDPNQVYVIGELEPDDFSSFEVTYNGNSQTIPVIVTYKDKHGNTFTDTFDVSRSSGGFSAASGSSSSSSPGSSPASMSGASSGGPGSSRGGMSLFGIRGLSAGGTSIPFMEIGIGLIVVIVIAIVAWKKGYLRKLHDRIPRRKPTEDDDDKADR